MRKRVWRAGPRLQWRAVKAAVRALLIAPLVAPILYWVVSFASALLDPTRRLAALHAPLTSFGLVLAFGSPVAYVAALVASAPAYWLLRQHTGFGLGALVVLGGIVGLATAVVIGPYLRGELFSIIVTPLQGAGLGASSAGMFAWLARDRSASD